MAQIPTFPISGPGFKSGSLSFVLSGRDLPMRDRGCTGSTVQDPYIKWTHKSNSQTDPKVWNLGGSTKHRINEQNPNYFDTVFTFEWLEGTGQVWRFEIQDFDVLGKDDVIGHLEVLVDDYVANGQEFYGKLNGTTQGALLVKLVNMVKFKLSARDLIKLDAFSGLSDPYVECYWVQGKGGPETQFAKTKTIKNVENCEWDDVIEFPVYTPGTNQFWVFKVFDKDPLPRDDAIGEAYISVDEFVRSKGIFICNLSDKKGNDSKLLITPMVA